MRILGILRGLGRWRTGTAVGLALRMSGQIGFAGPVSFPSYQSLTQQGWRDQLLVGPQRQFVFTMYGVPGQLSLVRHLVHVMQADHLGNGFDPGPTARAANKPLFDYLATVGWPLTCYPGCADMQVDGGRCVLTPQDKAALAALDRAGIFNAVQLGEWGYYFHNLSWNESWWHDVYGQDIAAFRHLMKPCGLAGYDTRPTTRRACYDAVRAYYLHRRHALLDRVISVTGHSQYEAYAAEWGARCIGLEVGENIAFTQSKFAIARGASRQWQRPWSVQVSPWFAGACTTSGPLRQESGGARGLAAGHSLSLYERMWFHAWFAGAAMVTPENSLAFFFQHAPPPWTLTAYGRKAAAFFQFTRHHDRGVPWTPVAIVLDHLAGYNGYMGKPWGILKPTLGDSETSDLFDDQLFPGSDFIHHPPVDPSNPESGYLRPTPYGEMFDVLLSSASARVLKAHPVILLVGDIRFTPHFLAALAIALRHGSRLLITAPQRATLSNYFAALQQAGAVEVLPTWTNPATGRPAAIPNERLRQLAQTYLPVQVSGDPIQYEINRTAVGWVVELVNNAGVTKKPAARAVIDPKAIAHVTLRPRISCMSACAWRSGKFYPRPTEVRVEVGPGKTEFVEFRLRRQ